ncbi:hypothetical protein [Rhizobium sp. AC44/96]|nr:hypothetical protein [Rhizobium sp. AC44/96]
MTEPRASLAITLRDLAAALLALMRGCESKPDTKGAEKDEHCQ